MELSEGLQKILFTASAIIGVVFALLMVTRRNPIYSALCLIMFFLTVALDFLLLQAPFLAFMQILVYGGAVMVLYIFVIMLINPQKDDLPAEGGALDQVLAIATSLLLFFVLTIGLGKANLDQYAGFAALPAAPGTLIPNGTGGVRMVDHGSIEALGQELFANHLFVFELTSILILIAIVGSVHLSIRTRRKMTGRAPRKINVLPEHIREKIRQQKGGTEVHV